jgi:hypothetical protein
MLIEVNYGAFIGTDLIEVFTHADAARVMRLAALARPPIKASGESDIPDFDDSSLEDKHALLQGYCALINQFIGRVYFKIEV